MEPSLPTNIPKATQSLVKLMEALEAWKCPARQYEQTGVLDVDSVMAVIAYGQYPEKVI